MRTVKPTTAIALALVMALIVATPALAKPGGNAAAAAACRHGGFANYTDAAGHTFGNAGHCVRFAAHGGTLVPVASGPFSVVYSAPAPCCFRATLAGTGLEPSSSVTFAFVWPARSVSITFNSDASGNIGLVHDEQCTDINGDNATSVTAKGTPAGGVETTYTLPLPPAAFCP